MIEVTQADREFIETILRPWATTPLHHLAVDFIHCGKSDDAEVVQMLATYRQAAEARAFEAGVKTGLGAGAFAAAFAPIDGDEQFSGPMGAGWADGFLWGTKRAAAVIRALTFKQVMKEAGK